MEYTSNHIEMIKRAGALKYSIRQILYLLPDIDPIEFRKDFENENHIIHQEYNKARCETSMKIDEALQKDAKEGNTFAADLLDKRLYYNRVNELKQELFGN